MRKELVEKSRFLSLVLRHQPGAAGVALDANGWVAVDALLDGARRANRAITLEELREIVETNDKRRFALSEDGRRIRASQGHSVAVDIGMPPAEPPEFLYHGTVERFLAAILVEGLCKMARQHVHLSADRKTAARVGQRRGKPVILRVAAAAMRRAGATFYLSENGVWLTDQVAPEFLTREPAAD